MNKSISRDEVEVVLVFVKTVGELIKEVTALKGGIPSGELYTRLLSAGINISNYQAILGVLEEAGVIEVNNHFVRWIKE
jgi:hypothetical protein